MSRLSSGVNGFFKRTIIKIGTNPLKPLKNIIKIQLPVGHTLAPGAESFYERHIFAQRVRTNFLGAHKVPAHKTKRIMRLFEIRKISNQLSLDTHIAAASPFTAKLLVNFVREELPSMRNGTCPNFRGLSPQAQKEMTKQFADLADGVEKNIRFLQKDESIERDMADPLFVNVLHSAELVAQGGKLKDSRVIPVSPVFLILVRSLSGALLKYELGEKYPLIENEVKEKRLSGGM